MISHLLSPASESLQSQEAPPTEFRLIRAHVHASIATVLISALFGLLVSIKLHTPFGSDAWSTWGRLRYNHTQGIFFGWLGNAFLAFAYYVVPRLADRPVLSRKLGWAVFTLWNFAVVLPGWTLVFLGHSQPLEWAEFPIVVDVFVFAGFALIVCQFVVPFLRVGLAEIYVSGGYLIAGLIFTFLAYPIGNLVPELVPGAMGAAFSGLWIHDAVGLFVTPLSLCVAYWVIPATTGRPIWSHFLSMLGFWLLFFLYPLNGTHHYVYSAIPMSAQQGAILASIYLGMDVLLVTVNLLLSVRGATGLVASDIPLRFVWTGVVSYLVVNLQGSLQAVMPVNRFVHFTDWVIGHSHLAMMGFASMIAAGGIAHVWQRIPGVRCSPRLLAWSYWLILTGLVFMVIDLTIAGVVEAQLWESGAPWVASLRAAKPYWFVRSLTGGPIILGFLLFWVSLLTGPAAETVAAREPFKLDPDSLPPILEPPAPVHWLGSAYAAASVAGLGFFALSFLALGIIPARQLQAEFARTAPREIAPPTPAERRGRLIYARDGCSYCHTEQIRTIAADIARFGAPTAPWETRYDYPQLWGTRRIGPDLSREAGLRSNDWQLTHLYNPRLVVRDSVMPAYSYLFLGSPAKPSQEALDLLAYLNSLGANAQLTAVQEPSRSPGAALFAADCSSCHGEKADSVSMAAATLLPKPANLLASRFTGERLAGILWNGVPGSSMPAWRGYSTTETRDLIAFLLQLPRPKEETSPLDLPALARAVPFRRTLRLLSWRTG